MSLRNLFVLSLLVLPMGLCKAQSSPAKPVEPTAIGIVYWVDPASKELQKLPDEQWAEKNGNRDPRKVFVEVKGDRSTFRIKAGGINEFVFKTGSPEKVSLYLFDQKKNKREVQTMKLDITGGGQLIKGLPVEVSQFGEKSYKLVPASPITPGEYVILIAGEAYTFGVDQ